MISKSHEYTTPEILIANTALIRSLFLILTHRGVLNDQILDAVFAMTKEDMNLGVGVDSQFTKGACAFVDMMRDNMKPSAPSLKTKM
ncbi:hypothetical protein [Mesorhizobium sangaii]|uniref:Uncharacterized protein n=1 Tax=Mesorhizobium sangaii TaxID=505389 RepID=A0A841PB37_9HYPH|nr:hypothetical protein [Mesorhizobium sangaii]MBB6410821.1 hypothetical protein [Mesorhizobium sangaii]